MHSRRQTAGFGFHGGLVRHLTSLFAFVCVGGALGMGGCSNQQEGERCTFFNGGDAGENGTDECASGLICTVTSYYTTDMATTGVGTLGVCCPPSGTAATALACQPTVGGSTTGGSPVGDGSVDATTTDGATTTTDAGTAKDAGTTTDAGTAKDATTGG